MKENMNFIKNIIKKFIWVVVFILAAGLLLYMLAGNIMSKNNQRYYLQGLEFVNKKDYQNAYYNFSSVERGNEFYCPAKYRAALAAQNLYDKESAAQMYKDVIDACAGSLFDESSRYNLAKLYFEKGDTKKAEGLFESLAKSAVSEKYQTASNYFLGEIYSAKSEIKALDAYLYYLEYAPIGKYSKEAISGLKKISRPLNSEQHYTLAKALYKNGFYADAKSHFAFVPIEKSWFYLAMCARKLGDYKQVQVLLKKGLSEYSANIDEEELHEAIDIFAMYSTDLKSGYLQAVNILTPKSLSGGDYALYKYIDKLSAKEKLPYYHQIVNNYPNGRFASDALWNLIWAQYKKGNYDKVMELAQTHSQKYSTTISAPRVQFFAAKAAEKRGNYAKARGYYGTILEKYPDDYYAFRSKLLLDGRKTAWTVKGKRQLNTNNKKIKFPLNYCKIQSKDMPVLNLLMNVGDWKLLELLLEDNKVVESWVNYKAGNKALSIVQARDFISSLDTKPDFGDDIYKLAYPMYFENEINKYSKVYDLDPYVVIAIIKEESHFDTQAKSYVGAGGLMQVMPDTAKFIAQKYSLSYDAISHNDVESNIELGCAYLDYALSQLAKKYLFAVAGYNGGHNAVKNWHNTLNYTDFDEFVEEIPYSETQTYIRKVFKSYWNYLNIYDRID